MMKAKLGLILFTAASVMAAENGTNQKNGKIEDACVAMINDSVTRDSELAKMATGLVPKMQAIVSAVDPKLGKMNQTQQDEYNLSLAQLRYIQNLGIAEIAKRRTYREILDLALVQRTQEEIFYELIRSGSFNDMAKINEETDRLLDQRLGPWATLYITKGAGLKTARQVHVALTISFDRLVDRLHMASTMPSVLSDDLELFYSDGDLSQSQPYQLFRIRLASAVSAGDKGAKEVSDFLDNEWMKPVKK